MKDNYILTPDIWKKEFNEETKEILLKRKLSEFDSSINLLLMNKNIIDNFLIDINVTNDKVLNKYNCGSIRLKEKNKRNEIECSLTPDEINYSMYYEFDKNRTFLISHRCDKESEKIYIEQKDNEKAEIVLYDLQELSRVSNLSELRYINQNDLNDIYSILDNAINITNNLLFNEEVKSYEK